MEVKQNEPTIAQSAQACRVSFQQCLEQMATLHPREQSLVEDQLGRFSIWTANSGTFALRRASMDHRLREAPDVRSAVIGLLDALDDRIQHCSSVVERFSGLQPVTSEDNKIIATKSFENAVPAIADEISLLYKLSNIISRASKDSQNLKAAITFKIKDDEGNDLEEVLRERFAANILDQFRNISEVIQKRLASTMLIRRKRILYRRFRHAGAPIRPMETVSQPTLQPYHARPQSAAQPIRHENFQLSDEPTLIAKPSQSIVQSHSNTATTLAADKFKKASSPSVVSATKTVSLGNHEDLTFPPAPRGYIKQRFKQLKAKRQLYHAARLSALPNYSTYVQHGGVPPLQPHIIAQLQQEISDAEKNLRLVLEKDWKDCNEAVLEVTCPFCFYSISSRDMKDEKKWREHVKNDLDAYICLFEECDKPEELYKHSEEWLKHMRQHASHWRCNSKSHDVQLFDSRDDYQNHIRERHKGTFTEAQLPLLAEINARNTDPMFKSCPLCGTDEVKGRLEDHIVGHLRFLALKSLPRIDDGEDKDSEREEAISGAFNLPSRSTIKKDPEYNVRLIFDYDDTYARAPERDNRDSDLTNPYAAWGGYTNYLTRYPKGLMLPISPTGEPDQLFELPVIFDGNDYPLSWSTDHSASFVDVSLFAGVSSADLGQFEWGVVLDMLQPYEGHESDPILKPFLERRRREAEELDVRLLENLGSFSPPPNVPVGAEPAGAYPPGRYFPETNYFPPPPTGEHYPAYNPADTSETGDQLKTQLRDKLVECPLGSQLFIVPRCAQESLITESTVKRTIWSFQPYITKAELDDKAQRTCQHARHLFATLAFIKKEKEICRFLDEGVTDEDLPLQRKFDDVENDSQWLLLRRSGKQIITLDRWTPKSREKFSNAQRLMTSPVFENGEHYELESSIILPFISFKHAEGKELEFRGGGYSEVLIKCIHQSHHSFWERSTPMENCLVAIKRLISPDETEFRKEESIHRRLGPKNHPNLIQLLATYRREKKWHLIFPYADANLLKYWEHIAPSPNFEETVLWSLKQMYGIADGLQLIHIFAVSIPLSVDGPGQVRVQGDARMSVEKGEEWYGRHGDIKPENILWFKDDLKLKDKNGVLKIADFGLGRFHGRESRSRVNPNTVLSSPTYEPPELQLGTPVSRAYDFWSLGCLYLEFISWLLGGWEAVVEFADRRAIDVTPDFSDDNFFSITNRAEDPKGEIRDGVTDWAKGLHEHERCSPLIHDLIRLIMEKMLVIDSKKRIEAADLKMRMREFVDKAEQDEKYFLEPKPWPNECKKTTLPQPDKPKKNLSVRFLDLDTTIPPARSATWST